MYFTDDKYNKISMNLKFDEHLIHNPEDAFFLLINNLDYDSLDLLCEFIINFYNYERIDNKLIYNQLQNLNLNSNYKTVIFNLAKQCITKKLTLGNKMTIDGKFNTTSWISHSIYVGEVCSKLAHMIDLNPDVAQTIGLLHDYGRREEHSFNHITKGFEKLVDLGWINESIGCLTHSFVNGGRCSNNESAIEGFYVDENGNQMWEDNVKKDDLTLFLENYQYTKYDLILNIADLMATDKGIVSPFDRIKDIATRRTIDHKNRGFFLSELNNLLIDFLKNSNCYRDDLQYIKADKYTSIEQIEKKFYSVSNIFFEEYQNFNLKKQKLNK